MAEQDAPDAQISSTNALKYWNDIPGTIDGMLGGYPQVSRVDLRGSAAFLERLRRTHPASKPQLSRCVDCGAGIGRVTSGFLSKVCPVVDVVEPVEKYAAAAKALSPASPGDGRVGEVFVTGLEDWKPTKMYDLIWNQWCLGHLRDDQLVSYFGRCKAALNDGGWIVVKENMSTDLNGKDVFDQLDSSVTRTHESFKSIFDKSGLKVMATEIQKGFPKSLYPVRFYALQPR